MFKICKLASVALCFCAFSNKAVGQSIVWKTNFGGLGNDHYVSVTAVSDGGVVAVGHSDLQSFNGGDLEGEGKGAKDAIIAKHDANGNVVWKKSFGGSGDDYYHSVTAVSDGVVAVGRSATISGGDLAGLTGKGGEDAIIVKYNNDGTVAWIKNFGGSSSDQYLSVTAVSDGIVAVGHSASFNSGSLAGNGDLTGLTGNGGTYGNLLDAIIVKYNNNGDVAWIKNFGGGNSDYFNSVTAVSDGVIAVGYSSSFDYYNNYDGSGDLAGLTGNGGECDAIMVKYNNNGDVVWIKHFGGDDSDYFNSVTAVSDGIIAAGHSFPRSFGNGDWAGTTGKNGVNAIVVKYGNDGSLVWKKNFGDSCLYNSVTTVSDGVVAVGYAPNGVFGNGDWNGTTGKGDKDGIIVKYDNNGTVAWKKNFGGSHWDYFNAVTTSADGNSVVAAGYSYQYSFGNGNWMGVSGKSAEDATMVKFGLSGENFVAVSSITNVATTATVGTPLTLTGTVNPSNATNKNIKWSVANAGTTGANVTNNILTAAAAGTVKVRATIEEGAAEGINYTEEFDITVNPGVGIVESHYNNSLIVYPNPAKEQLTIENLDMQYSTSDIRLFDIMGRLLQSTIVNLNSKITVDISHLPCGMYYLKAGNKVVKVVKE